MKKNNDYFKRLWMLIATLAFCVCLTACDSSNYKKAERLLNNGDYAAALELYENLGLYEDSQDKAKLCRYSIASSLFDEAQYEDALIIYEDLGEYQDCAEQVEICKKEIGMTANADYSFLADIELSVLSRMSAADGTDYTDLVHTELAYLSKYENASFYDDRLQEISNQYINGLHIQRDALKSKYEWEYQVEWQRGMVLRYEALTQLHDEFGLLKDNTSFIATYVMQYEDAKKLLDAYDAIEADIHAQTSADDFYDTIDYTYDDVGAIVSFTIKNNTEYTYSTVFEFSFLSDDNTLFYSNNAFIENINPGNSYVVSVYVDFTDCPTEKFYYNWNNHYTDVQY